MCTGIGSFEMAMRNLKIPHKSKFAIEIDKYAKQTFLANFETETMYNDMTSYDYVGNKWYSDLLVAGIPCQAFSLAGKRLGELDPRGLLFFDFYRYVKNQNPKYFIIENVKGLLSDNDGNTFQNWINLLGQSVNGDQFMFPHEDSLMYNLHWQVLNTKDYGLPQNRERVFLIGIRNDLPNSFVFPKGVPLTLRLKDILEDEVDEKYYLSEKMLNYLTNTKFTQDANLIQKTEICATLLSTDYKSPKCVRVNSATKSGYETATEGDSINLEHPDSQTRRGRVGKQVAQTLTTSCNQGVMVVGFERTEEAKIKRSKSIKENGIDTGNVTEIIQLNNPKHSNDRIYSDEGLSPTLNTMQGGNRQPFIQVIGSTGGKNDHNSRIYGTDGISPTILAGNNGGGQSPVKHLTHDYRIRKLSPLECFRLQGFPDEFLQNAIDAGVSNSQLYKQAGNSISVPVIQAILKNLLT